jgi:hypothetical protein
MKASSITFLLYIALTSACGENAYRCVNPDGSVEDDWAKTQECAVKLGTLSECWCWGLAQFHIDAPSDKIDAFKKCCESSENFGWREC